MGYNRGIHETSSRGCTLMHPGLSNSVGGAATMLHDNPDVSSLKVCTKCGQAKPLSEFYQYGSGKRAGRYIARCRVCTDAQLRKWRAANPERIKEVKREGHLRERIKNADNAEHHKRRREYQSEYYARNSDRIKATVQRHIAKYPQRHAARMEVGNAIHRGDLPHPTTLLCLRCGGPAAEYHHASYEPADWLKVEPLCSTCHGKEHRRNNNA